MAAAPVHDERDRMIAELRAEVEHLKTALRARPTETDASDAPLFGRGLSGGAIGGLEVAVGGFALLILMTVMHHLMSVS